MAAAGKGRLHELSLLLAAGAKPELQSKGGTAREWALRFDHTEAADMLQLHEQALQEADAATGGIVALSHYQVRSRMLLGSHRWPYCCTVMHCSHIQPGVVGPSPCGI